MAMGNLAWFLATPWLRCQYPSQASFCAMISCY